MVICFIMVMIALGLCSSTRSLFLAPITEALDLERGPFSISDSCRYISTAILNLFFGALVVKWGPKRMISLGFIALILFALIYSFAETYWQFCVGGVMLGIGLAWTTTTLVGYVVNQWFTSNRGTIMGAILASNGLCTAIASPIMQSAIDSEKYKIVLENGNIKYHASNLLPFASNHVPANLETAVGAVKHFGYQDAYRGVALILLAVLVLVLIFFRNAPKSELTQQAPAKKKPSRGDSWIGISYKDAIKRPYFYVAAVCVFFTGAALQAVSGVQSAHLKSLDLGALVATALSFYAICLAGSKFLAGFCFDHLGLKVTMIACNIAGTLAIFMLCFMPMAAGTVTVFSYEVLLAIAMPLETIMLPLIVADMFGEKEYGKFLGLFVSINTAGYALGPLVTNWVYDAVKETGINILGFTFKGYQPSLFVMGILLALITVTFQFVLNASGKEKKKILANQ